MSNRILNRMKEIKGINIRRMNNGAHYSFVNNILTRAADNAAALTRVESLVAALREAFAAEEEALRISQKSMLTDDIAEADRNRDMLYSGYRKAVRSYSSMPVEEMAKAAKVLLQHINDYSIRTNYQLDRESGLMISFLEDLEGKYAGEVEVLGLTTFVTRLKEANERVYTLTLRRTIEKAGVKVGALKAARLATDGAYRALIKMVNALALVFGDTDLAPFIDGCNAEIARYKRDVLGKKSSSSSS